MKKTKKLTIEDTLINLSIKSYFKDDDGFVYIIFSEFIYDAEDFTYCIFDCPNCKNYVCKADF